MPHEKFNQDGFFRMYKTKTPDKLVSFISGLEQLTDSDEEIPNILDEYLKSDFTREDLQNLPEVTKIFIGSEKNKLCKIIASNNDI